jgi:hypothetical protein
MPTRAKIINAAVLLFCALLGGGIGYWLPGRGTAGDGTTAGLVGGADGVMMAIGGIAGFFLGLGVGAIGMTFYRFQLNKSRVSAVGTTAQTGRVDEEQK